MKVKKNMEKDMFLKVSVVFTFNKGMVVAWGWGWQITMHPWQKIIVQGEGKIGKQRQKPKTDISPCPSWQVGPVLI